MSEQDIIKIIEEDKWMMEILQSVEELNLKDWWIGAGFVRSKVWDSIHGYKKRTPLPDIDIIYFNPKAKDVIDEQKYWKILKDKYPKIKWSVTNDAYRHLRIGRTPYKSSEEALSEWVETATCVGVRIKKGKIILSTPLGIDDLVNLIVRRSPTFKNDKEVFNKRLKNKKWIKKWPKLKIIN